MDNYVVHISQETRENLALLKLAWGKRTLGEVIDELLRPHLMERIKALGIEVKDERSPTT